MMIDRKFMFDSIETASKIYYPLHHPPNLHSMLSGVNGVSSVYSLNLSNNGISRFSCKKNEIGKVLGNFKHLKSLDLRGNNVNFQIS
jgi:Leucine-rich repeat (LRR) protein